MRHYLKTNTVGSSMARNRFQHRGPKRLTAWAFAAPINATLAAAGGTLMFSLNAAALAVRPFTIVRSHWAWMLQSDQSAGLEDQVGAFGVAVVSDQAEAVGITALPTPITDLGSDLFFVHQMMMARQSNLTDRTFPAVTGFTDSKAMRKVNDDQDMVVTAEFSAAGAGFILTLGGRFLLKMH